MGWLLKHGLELQLRQVTYTEAGVQASARAGMGGVRAGRSSGSGGPGDGMSSGWEGLVLGPGQKLGLCSDCGLGWAEGRGSGSSCLEELGLGLRMHHVPLPSLKI